MRLVINNSEDYSVGRVDGSMEPFIGLTLSEANIAIESIAQSDPHGVDSGDYYIDGPATYMEEAYAAPAY